MKGNNNNNKVERFDQSSEEPDVHYVGEASFRLVMGGFKAMAAILASATAAAEEFTGVGRANHAEEEAASESAGNDAGEGAFIVSAAADNREVAEDATSAGVGNIITDVPWLVPTAEGVNHVTEEAASEPAGNDAGKEDYVQAKTTNSQLGANEKLGGEEFKGSHVDTELEFRAASVETTGTLEGLNIAAKKVIRTYYDGAIDKFEEALVSKARGPVYAKTDRQVSCGGTSCGGFFCGQILARLATRPLYSNFDLVSR